MPSPPAVATRDGRYAFRVAPLVGAVLGALIHKAVFASPPETAK